MEGQRDRQRATLNGMSWVLLFCRADPHGSELEKLTGQPSPGPTSVGFSAPTQPPICAVPLFILIKSIPFSRSRLSQAPTVVGSVSRTPVIGGRWLSTLQPQATVSPHRTRGIHHVTNPEQRLRKWPESTKTQILHSSAHPVWAPGPSQLHGDTPGPAPLCPRTLH